MSSPNITIDGIAVKKKYGQHFLRQQHVVDTMINAVSITPQSSLLEIGCGDGFLTQALLQTKSARIWVFEIDHEWATYVQHRYPDPRMSVYEENILDVPTARLIHHQPWILLANLPYQITFPILHLLQQNKHLFQEGVIMVQEEVAQKITKTSGRGYGFISLFFQYHFSWQPLTKVPPTAFQPPPKVESRLLHFRPNKNPYPIPHEQKFWNFIKSCFLHPRRTLKNNIKQTPYSLSEHIDQKFGHLRAQQMSMEDFLHIWNHLDYSTTR